MKPLSLFQGYRCCAEDGLPTFQPHFEDLGWHTAHIVSGSNNSWALSEPLA